MEHGNAIDGPGLRLESLTALTGFSADEAARVAGSGRTAEAAVAFETLLTTMLVREMRRALPEGPFGSGPGASVYETWFDQHLGRSMAERNVLGIAGMVKTALGRASAEALPGPGSENKPENPPETEEVTR